MGYIPITPFRRTVDAGLFERQKHARAEFPPGGVNKWEVLRELSAARVTFGLGDRDMAVLQALLSFCPETILAGNSLDLVVHPSNRSICERLNGMPESTMRRYLAHLVEAGVLLRRDSPNGKRYARHFGEDKEAFGFDLTPLVSRFEEFCRAAEEVRASTESLRRQREKVSLMRRDLAGLAAYGAENRPDLLIWQNHERLADLASKAPSAQVGRVNPD
ncbi:MAG: plasmid replication protein RepC [Gemmobacter sp.]